MYIKLSIKERRELISQLRVMAHPNISFYALMVLSTLIAGFGLLANSTAVVIGAMLVAPLMGPIFGMTLALVIGDRKLFFEAMLAEATGVILAILIGVLIGSLPMVPVYGSEISSRIQPTLFDAVIALASGLAGGYVLVNPKLNAGIAGVAIATALVPPLAVCGLELAAGAFEAAGSALLLFITNFFAILLSAAWVFMLAGLERIHEEGPSRWLHLMRTFGPGVVALTGLTVFLTYRLVDIVSRDQLENRIVNTLDSRMAQMVRGAEQSECNIDFSRDPLGVESVVLSWRVFDNQMVAELKQAIEQETRRGVDLVVRTYTTHDYDNAGKHYWDSDEEVREQQRLQAQQAQQELDQVEDTMRQYLSQIPGCHLVEAYRDPPNDNGHLAFTAEVETIKPLSPQQIGEMQQLVTEFLSSLRGQDTPVYLRVRQDNVRYTDAEGYIFEAKQADPPPGHEELKQQLFHSLAFQLGELQPGAILDDLHHRRALDLRIYDNGGSGVPMEKLIVQASVYSPQLFTAQQIAECEDTLSEMTAEHVWLQFDNFIRAYIDSSGIQRGFTNMDTP